MQKPLIGCYIPNFDNILLSNFKNRSLYESSDGPGGQPAGNLPNSDGLGDLHWTILELTVWVYFQLGLPIWQWFGSDLDQESKTQSVSPEQLLTLLGCCDWARLQMHLGEMMVRRWSLKLSEFRPVPRVSRLMVHWKRWHFLSLSQLATVEMR